jgi:hypothetical protein
MFPNIGGLYDLEEEGSRPTSGGPLRIPQSSAGRPHSPGKFRNEMNFSEPPRDKSESKKIFLEVTITADQLKQILKCQPSDELFSRKGKALKQAFPELGKAKEKEKKELANLSRKKAIVDAPPFDVKYNAMVHWKGSEKDDDSVSTEYMKVLKYIILREGSIRRLEALVDAAEVAYWKYAAVIINRKEFDRSILTDDIAEMKTHINNIQEELAVAIAHHRSVSVSVVESVER